MLPQYQMVLVSGISSLILILCLLFIKYIYPQKKINLFILLILISCLPLISILREGTYESGDLSLHAALAMPFFESLKEGNIIPVWNQYILKGFGYPLYLFIYPLPYYLASFIHAIGFTFVDSIKILLIISFIGSGISMYSFVKEELQNSISAFVSTIFYLFAPYHLVDLHFRIAIGENLAFMFLPLCFFLLKKVSSTLSLTWVFLFSLCFNFLILSHQAISLISFPFLLIYSLLLYGRINKRKKFIALSFLAFIIGLLLSFFYWFPVIYEARYTNLLSKENIYFPSFFEFIYSPWRMGFLYQGHKGELSFIIGYMHWIIILLSLFIIFKKTPRIFSTIISNKNISRNNKHLYYVSILSFFIIFILMQGISRPVWMNIFLLKGFQFSYRLLIFSVFFSSIIAGILILKINKKLIIYLICIMTIGITILNWGNRRTLPEVTDKIIKAKLSQSIIAVGPGTTIWTNSDMLKPKQSNIDLLNGNAKITEIYHDSTKHEYQIQVLSKSATFKENTLYFPNWTVKSNNKSVSFTYTDSSFPGLIVFNLKNGSYNVIINFIDTKIRSITKKISFGTLIIILFSSLLYYLRKLIKSYYNKNT